VRVSLENPRVACDIPYLLTICIRPLRDFDDKPFMASHDLALADEDEKLAFHFLNTTKYMGWPRIG